MDIKLTRWQRVKLGLSLAFRGVKQVDGAEGVFGILDLGSRSGRYKGKLQAYKDSPILKAPVWRIAKDIAAVDWKLVTFRGGEKVEVPDHPFINLLMKPTPLRFLTEFHLRYLTQAYLELCGDAYWLIERNRAGVPAELWVIPPTWVVGLPTPSLPSFEVQMAHARIRVDERDVVWFKDPDLLNPYGRGLGGAEPLDDEIATDEMASKWNRHFFGNNARPDVLVSIPGTTKEQIDRVREAWVAEHSGWKNAGKPRFINYEAKFEILTQNQKDMDFVNSRQHSKRTVRETYGVPPEILGDVSNSNRATIEAAELIYTKFVLKPRLMLLTDALNTFLKTEFDEGLFLEFENIVSEDREQKLQVANEGISRAAITVNEWRDSMGWDPRPDGDKLLLPFSVIPTATLNQSDEASPNQSQALGMRPSDPLRSRGLRTVLKKKASQ